MVPIVHGETRPQQSRSAVWDAALVHGDLFLFRAFQGTRSRTMGSASSQRSRSSLRQDTYGTLEGTGSRVVHIVDNSTVLFVDGNVHETLRFKNCYTYRYRYDSQNKTHNS